MKRCGKISSGILFGLIIIAGIAAYWAWGYASLIKRTQAINMVWNEVRLQNKQQIVLVDSLVSAIESANLDQLNLDDIIDAQTSCAMLDLTDDLIDNKHDFNEYIQKYDNLEAALEVLLSNLNDDPNLKLKYRTLIDNLVENKTKLTNALQNYNSLVIAYNEKLGVFPDNILSGVFNFSVKNPYQFQ